MLAGKGKDTLLLLTVSLHGHWHHRAMGDTRERLALSGSRIPDSLLGLLWHQPIEKCTLLLIGVGEEQVSHLTWFLLAPQVEGNLLPVDGNEGFCLPLGLPVDGNEGFCLPLGFLRIRMVGAGVTPSYSHMRWKSRLPNYPVLVG